MVSSDILVVERSCAEQLFSKLGCRNVRRWEDDLMVERLRHAAIFYDPRIDVGDYHILLSRLACSGDSEIVLRYGFDFPECVESASRLAVLKDGRVRGLKKRHKRDQPFSFAKCGIPAGATLVFKPNPEITCTVEGDPWRVDFGDDSSHSFSQRTRILAGAKDWVSPKNYWLYEGKLLRYYYKKVQLGKDRVFNKKQSKRKVYTAEELAKKNRAKEKLALKEFARKEREAKKRAKEEIKLARAEARRVKIAAKEIRRRK